MPYYVELRVMELGLTAGDIDGPQVRIYDKERVICDCLHYRNKMGTGKALTRLSGAMLQIQESASRN